MGRPQPLFILKNVCFKDIIHYPGIEIPESLVTFICGESGCGKSTLLKLLNGVISADSGVISYAGRRVDDYDPVMLRREVLLCGQSAHLFDGSIQDNFIKYCEYREVTPVSPEEASKALKICAAEFPLYAACGAMSGGERHRVFTAICLSFRPKVLLLDEPTSALDDMTAHKMMAKLKDYCREEQMTLIVVSHNRALAESYADYTILLEGGGRYE